MSRDSGYLKRLIPAFALVVLLLLLTNARAIAEHRFPDPDDALRLQEVRDWLGGQGWFDLTQHRLDPFHGGVAMHWTRLVDLPLAGVMLALRPLLGMAGAELAARILVPLLTLGVIMTLMARLAWLRLGARSVTMTCLMLMMSAPFVTQILPMRIDHHGWQIACAVLALSGLLARRVTLGAWLAGLAMAASLEISVEGLPLAAIFAAVGALRWFRHEPTRLWLAHYMAALASASLLLFALLRGFGDLAQHCDQMSPVQLAVVSLAALGSMAGAAFGARWPFAGRVIAMGVLGALAGALYLGIAPQCRAGSFDMLSPLARDLWYNQVDEGLAIWHQLPSKIVQITFPPLFALFALWRIMQAHHGRQRLIWRDYALVLIGAQAVALLVARAAGVSGAFTALPLAWLVQNWLERAHASPPLAKAGWLLAIVAAVQPSAPVILYQQLAPSPALPAQPAVAQSNPVRGCHLDQGARVLAEQPTGLVLTGLDSAPALLLDTHHTMLASAHHRGARAIDALIRIFTAPEDKAHALIRQERVDYLAVCPDATEFHIYARAAPQGLAADLIAGHVPAWLEPLAGSGGGLQLFKVKG